MRKIYHQRPSSGFGVARIVLHRGNKRIAVTPDFRDERAREDFKNFVTRPEVLLARR